MYLSIAIQGPYAYRYVNLLNKRLIRLIRKFWKATYHHTEHLRPIIFLFRILLSVYFVGFFFKYTAIGAFHVACSAFIA
jgi:hypothetical protein